MLQVEHLTLKFGGLVANNDVSMTVEQGKITGLIGPNGAGKTTFFNSISGVYRPTSGTVTFLGKRIDGLQPYQINQLGMSRTYQVINLFRKMSVVENVMVGMHPHMKQGFFASAFKTRAERREERECYERAYELLDFVNLKDRAFEEAEAVIAAYEAGEAEAYLYDADAGEVITLPATEDAYAAARAVTEPDPCAYGAWVPGIPVLVEHALDALGCNDVVKSLVLDGIVGGVGAVLGFVPQMLALFLLLALLEDVGYMSRVAFIMDRLFRRFGLSGKSFIPLLVGTGCSVPGVMAARTIDQDRDRKMTIMTTGFIPCGAKMPIIGLFAGAVFGDSPWVATSAFFIGIAAVVISGIMLKKFKAFAGEPAPFVMELPAYHAPSASNVLRATWERGWSFIKRAGTIILLSSIVLWFLMGYGVVDGVFQAVEDNNDSLLAAIGSGIAVIFAPLGWVGDMAWKATTATFTGLIAKEEVVNFFGVAYHYAGEADLMEDASGIYAAVGADFGAMAAYSFMIFNLLCAPCFAAMGAIKREMNNVKWTLGAIGYMCGFAYVVSLIVFQLGGLVTGEAAFGIGTVTALILLAGILYLLFRKGYQGEENTRRLTSVAAAVQ